MSCLPSYSADLFSDEAIVRPYEHYLALRQLGAVVWLDANQMYVLPRYAEVRAALADPEAFCSGRGVGMNDFVNTVAAGTTLMSDGEVHDLQRAVLARGLIPRALRPIEASVQTAANTLVDDLVDRGTFDAITDLARALPLSIVPDLVGWPLHGRASLLEWAAASFDVIGPLNARAERAGPRVAEMLAFAAHTVADRDVMAGSAAADMLDAVDEGRLTQQQAASLIIDYLAPSLDTTISAIGSAVWLFGREPAQWDLLRDNPSLLTNAVNEVLRVESPIRGFTRVLTRATRVGDHALPADGRVLVLFASANRDERRWDNAESFDITRNANGQLGFGYGSHGCVGQGLARLEIQAVLRALMARVDRFILGTPAWALNNNLRALAGLSVTVQPSAVVKDGAARQPTLQP